MQTAENETNRWYAYSILAALAHPAFMKTALQRSCKMHTRLALASEAWWFSMTDPKEEDSPFASLSFTTVI